MVGSTFILLERPDRKTLLNAAQIVSAYIQDIDLSSNEGNLLYEEYDPAQGTLYTIQLLLTSRREMEQIYTTAAARDEVFARLVEALAPSITITSTGPRPVRLPEVPMPPRDRPRYERPVSTAPAEPVAPKPPRKPHKPRG